MSVGDEGEKQVFVEGVGLVPVSALEMAFVVAGVDLREFLDAEVVDLTESGLTPED